MTAEEIVKIFLETIERNCTVRVSQSGFKEWMLSEKQLIDLIKLAQSKAPDKEIIEEELDLMQYVTNLLYAAYRSCDTQSEFDEWVETNVELLKKYAQSKALPEMSDSEIEKHFTSEHYDNSNGHHYRIKKDRIFGAKWYRDRNKQQ